MEAYRGTGRGYMQIDGVVVEDGMTKSDAIAAIAQAARDGGADVLVVDGGSVLASGPAVPEPPAYDYVEEAGEFTREDFEKIKRRTRPAGEQHDVEPGSSFEEVVARMSPEGRARLDEALASGAVDEAALRAEVERLASDPIATSLPAHARYMPRSGEPGARPWDGSTRMFNVAFSADHVAHGEWRDAPANVVATRRDGRQVPRFVYSYKERMRLPSNAFVRGMTRQELDALSHGVTRGLTKGGWPAWPAGGEQDAKDEGEAGRAQTAAEPAEAAVDGGVEGERRRVGGRAGAPRAARRHRSRDKRR